MKVIYYLVNPYISRKEVRLARKRINSLLKALAAKVK